MSAGLDRADALPVGGGKLDLFAFVDSSAGAAPSAGVKADYEARVKKSMSIFATGWADVDQSGLNYGAMAGLRWHW